MSIAHDGSGRESRRAGEGQLASQAPPANNGRSLSKVAFKDERDEYEYRDRYSGSSSSDSEQTSCSTSEDSSSTEHGRGSYRRRRHRDNYHGRRNHSPERHHRRGYHRPRERRQELQGPSSSSLYDAHAAMAAPLASGPASGVINAAPANNPQIPLQPQQGTPFSGPGAVAHPHQHQQPLSMALVPPPGCGPFPTTSSNPSTSTPTKAYTSPRSVHDPPPTLLLSSYGGHHPNCPSAATAAAAAFSSVAGLAPASLMAPMQTLALNGGVVKPSQAALTELGASYNPGMTVTAPTAMQSQQLHTLPPPPVALPLALPEASPYALQQQQQQAGLSMLYDETMQEVVLADAVMVRELAKQGHGLAPLADAYRTKLAALQATVNGPLLAKREALMQQHARLAARAGEVAAQRAGLEREVAILAEDMVGRIRGAESLKHSVLAREQADVGVQLDAIQRLLGDIMAASAAGAVDFLNAYSRLTDTCSRLVSKPFKQVVDVAADDLPSEAAVYRDLTGTHEALKQLLGIKDQMIAHLLKERDTLQDELRQVVERYNAELSALEAQCQGYHQRLLALGAGGAAAAGQDSARGSPCCKSATAVAGRGSPRG